MLTKETLLQYYLNDITLPDTLHGRDRAKVSRPEMWKKMNPVGRRMQCKDLVSMVNDRLDNMFVWSDQHFGHKNIIKYTGRPFEHVDDMTQQMIDNYKSVITNDDVVIFNGDVTFMNLCETNEILAALPGYKILIVGNHDISRKSKQVMDLYFDEIHVCMQIVVDNRWQMIFTHYPLTTVPDKCINVHGHIHDNLSANPQHFNVCVEHTNYTPKPLREVVNTGNSLF